MTEHRDPEEWLPAAADGPVVPIHLIGKAAWSAMRADDWRALAPPPLPEFAVVRQLAEAYGFTAAAGEALVIPGADGLPALVLGGCEERLDCWTAAAVAEALPQGCYRIDGPLEAGDAKAAALGFALAQYRFYLGSAGPAQRRRRLLVPEPARGEALEEARAVYRVRDLVNMPANRLGPAALAEEARALAARFGAEIAVHSGEALLAEGFPAVHAVGAAGHEPPHLISLRWGDADAPVLALVGKGVCFDSGGLDLKSAQAMRLMKKDMGGAAHALALAERVMTRNLPVRLHLVIPAVMNAVAARAYRPGDVIATRKGLAVEIGNTDAEGRLVLADALAYADEDKPALIIDFATLTGAARVALGPDLPALFTRDDALAEALLAAGRRLSDPLWRLPLHEPYLADLKSEIADLNNIADHGFAGAIIAALFLDRFVAHAHSYAHFDIYAWNGRARPGRPVGGEAFALRAALAVIQDRFAAG